MVQPFAASEATGIECIAPFLKASDPSLIAPESMFPSSNWIGPSWIGAVLTGSMHSGVGHIKYHSIAARSGYM